MRRLWLAVGWIAASVSSALAQEGSLTLPTRVDDPVRLVVPQALTPQTAPQILRVFVGPAQACCAGKTPMIGSYDVSGTTLTFQPAFDFIAGQTYAVQFGRNAQVTDFSIAAFDGAAAPKLVAIHPSGPVIPENTLRFYLQFSEPMMPHRAAEFIQLVNAEGQVDTAAFMAFTQELWNAERTRLTLLMDPGRIKRGVAQNAVLGPALTEGRSYKIVIKDGWPTARGNQVLARVEHAFGVSRALRHLPDVADWGIEAPGQGTLDPLVLSFDRPFDHLLSQRAIAIRDVSGEAIPGDIKLEAYGHRWRFDPVAPWRDAMVQIHVDPHLEDVAGNNFIDLLDHPLGTLPLQPKGMTFLVTLGPA